MLRNISPGAGGAIELSASSLRDRSECALSKKVDHIRLDEPSSRFLGELHANRDMLHGLMGCASYKVGTLQAHESIQRAEGGLLDFPPSQAARILQGIHRCHTQRGGSPHRTAEIAELSPVLPI